MNSKAWARLTRTVTAVIVSVGLGTALSGCVAGEGSGSNSNGQGTDTVTVDFATYNPLSLVIKDQGWLDDEFSKQGIKVNWVQSAGSNKANENLRAGTIDVGSTYGSAGLLARSNGAPIKTVYIYSQPENGLLVAPGSSIKTLEDLKGKTVAATKGTDPYFFLLRALKQEGISQSEVTIQNLQHADGKQALMNGNVDAWSGLDPIFAQAEQEGAVTFYKNSELSTYGFLNATEDFVNNHADQLQTIVGVYEKARKWAVANPDQTRDILAKGANIEGSVAQRMLDRSHLGVDPVPGEAEQSYLEAVTPILVDSGDVPNQALVDSAREELFEPSFAQKAVADDNDAN